MSKVVIGQALIAGLISLGGRDGCKLWHRRIERRTLKIVPTIQTPHPEDPREGVRRAERRLKSSSFIFVDRFTACSTNTRCGVSQQDLGFVLRGSILGVTMRPSSVSCWPLSRDIRISGMIDQRDHDSSDKVFDSEILSRLDPMTVQGPVAAKRLLRSARL